MRTWLPKWLGAAGALGLAAAVGMVVVSTATASAETAVTAKVTTNEVAVPRPPMGWASWNAYAGDITAAKIKTQADALVTSGMKDAGYQYVNIDDGWWLGQRDASGNFVVDEARWPGGMKAIADYIHSKGLKAGIYTDAGADGCGYYWPTGHRKAPGSGSLGHYDQDFLQFSKWGFDYVKVDWCGGSFPPEADKKLKSEPTFRAIAAAVKKAEATTGRELLLSICNWGEENPWDWAPGLGRMWRTSSDIILFRSPDEEPPAELSKPSLTQALNNFDKALHPTAQHTGYYNDPDMMTIGLSGSDTPGGTPSPLRDSAARTEMNLWAVLGAPLLAGNDLTTMTEAKRILTNAAVIAVDQDPRGLQGMKVAEDVPGSQVFSKTLAGSGNRAVVLLNRGDAPRDIEVRWQDLGLAKGSAQVRDLWTSDEAKSFQDSYTVTVPGRDSVMLRVTGTENTATVHEAEAAGNTLTGKAAAANCPNCSGGKKIGDVGNGAGNTLAFNGVGANASGHAVVDIAYLNGETTARSATMTVNDQPSTVVTFPPTGGWDKPGTVSVVVSLRQGAANSIKFANASGYTPDLDAIAVAAAAGNDGTEIVLTEGGRCLDVESHGASTVENGTNVKLSDCTGEPNQLWEYKRGNTLSLYGNKCMDVWGGNSDGTGRIAMYDCYGGDNQQWEVRSDGTIKAIGVGWCLQPADGNTASGTQVVIRECTSAAIQKWKLGGGTEPTPSPSPSPSVEPSPKPSPSVEPSPSPSPSVEPSPSPSVEPSPSPSVEPSPSPSPSVEPSPSPSPSVEPSPKPSPSVEPSPKPSPSVEPSPKPSPSASASPSPKPSVSASVPASPSAPSTPGTGGGDLPITGTDITMLGGLGAALSGAGVLLYLIARRRRQPAE